MTFTSQSLVCPVKRAPYIESNALLFSEIRTALGVDGEEDGEKVRNAEDWGSSPGDTK